MLRTAFRLRSALPAQRRITACVARSFSSYPPHEVIGLPSLSPTMETGNMSKWNMKEGDAISAGDIVCEIETDKAVVDYESTDDMFLAKILIPEGAENIPVGQPMMVVCDEEESVAAFKDFKLEDAPAAPAAPVLSAEEKPPKKEDVPVDAKTHEPVVPQDFLVTSQTTKKTVPGAAIPAPPAAKAAPAPKAAAPAPASSAVFEEKWGLGMKKSAISTSLIKKQQAYIALYGITGMTPVALPEKKK
ncbi:Dihydrolipoyllysine-residue acetyltransferase component of pyruvate dehydrogenase complex [Phytophthora palmivora]|uniref:Dihydrolipoyllysine-residue acetyltransferase component of pyruvate dehydrogenase complex n=1 Tax=Phytophthora palmivora TaxID=4796 RepID=A0A2P4Y151_9STRA|nr:Dihydrolipoyllysine-residue acetyltransferase component of pyruvate dehydrogenase complex [Phytophthora palmivora]